MLGRLRYKRPLHIIELAEDHWKGKPGYGLPEPWGWGNYSFLAYHKYEHSKTRINLGNVDWGGAALDTGGLILGLVEIANPIALVTGTAVGITDLARTTKMMLQGDATLSDVLVDTVGLVPGIPGMVADSADLVKNLSSAVVTERAP